MRKFIAMHESEVGYDSVEEVRHHILSNYATYSEEWRVVEIIVDPVTESIANLEHKRELEDAYIRGKEAAREEIKARLGL